MNLDLNQIQKDALPNASFGSGSSLADIISALLPYIFSIAGILILIYLIMGGLQLMTSGGDPKAMESAKGKITNALVGFVIVFASYWIVQLLANVLGLQGTGFGSVFSSK
jgi:hypothetical protein